MPKRHLDDTPSYNSYRKQLQKKWRTKDIGEDTYDYRSLLKYSPDVVAKPLHLRRSLKTGGIYIKPENRGKFTETMKRTGKTAEELSHSPNPLTRKRAIFALNARKWNH